MWPFRKPVPPQHPAPVAVIAPAQATASAPQSSRAVLPMERGTPQLIDIKTENIKSIIAHGESFEGRLRLQRGIKVDGYVKGDIEFGMTDGMLVVNDKARVDGDILGPRAIIVGEVFGNICITGRLIVLATARIHGDISAGTLQMHEGARIDGRICTSDADQKIIQEQPSVAQSISAVPVQPESPAAVLQFAIGAGQSR